MKGVAEQLAFNRGRISRLGMARVDLKRTALSAAIQTNWMSRVLGSMMLRPGFGYVATESGPTRSLPFIFSADDSAIVELHDEDVTFVVDDERLDRGAVTASITNGTFATDVSSWATLANTGTWVTGGGAQFIGLSGAAEQSLYQVVTINEPTEEHGVRLIVRSGVVRFGISENLGPDVFFNEDLGPGTYSIGFTPTGVAAVVLSFVSFSNTPAIVDSVAIEAAGDLLLPTPWTAADLQNVRVEQSGDVMFMCDGAHQQQTISRINERSWGIADYAPVDGPFRVENTSATTISASALVGNVSLVASSALFDPAHAGALFRLTSVGQAVTSSFTAANTFGNQIRVTGVGAARTFAIVITGTFVATVTLQYSVDEAVWYDHTNYTTPTSTSLTDGLDNQIIYYRLGVKTGNYTSGTAVSGLTYAAGSISGVVKIIEVTDSINATAIVLSDLGGTAATDVWAEGEWSDYRGWPSAVALHDGRLIWAGREMFFGSVTDQFYTFDPGFEGDAGPISRSIGSGPIDNVLWMSSLNRLIAGTGGSIVEVRSSSLDEPLTPTNFTPKVAATRGSAGIASVKIDNTALFAQRGATRVFEVDNSVGPNGGVLSTVSDVTTLIPEICEAGVVRMAVQRLPDTRLHAILNDGTAGVFVTDRAEDVRCWVNVETDGEIEDVCILPGTEEDRVYYVVKRTIDGNEVRYLEKWARESEARGAAVNKIADSFVYAAAASNVITGLGHLEGETVVAWGGGLYLGAFVVAGGSITLHASTTYTHRCAGLPYSAEFKSTKLAFSMQGRSGLTLKKKIDRLGLILVDTHPQSLTYGPSLTRLDPMPERDRHADVDLTAVWDEYDSEAFMFDGRWDTDSRLCLKATAPLPCTVLAAVIELETNAR